jgi:hypothetical protein
MRRRVIGKEIPTLTDEERWRLREMVIADEGAESQTREELRAFLWELGCKYPDDCHLSNSLVMAHYELAFGGQLHRRGPGWVVPRLIKEGR